MFKCARASVAREFIVTAAAVVVVKDGGDTQGRAYKLLEVDVRSRRMDGWLQSAVVPASGYFVDTMLDRGAADLV